VSPLRAALGALVGLAAGVLSGLFGVGGGIITTPAVNVLLGGSAIEAVATPAACRTWNLLLAEGRPAAAALVALPSTE